MSWKTLTVGQLGKVTTGKTPPTKKKEYFHGVHPFISPSDLSYDTYRVLKTEKTVSDFARSKFHNQFVPSGSILYTCIASVGKIGIAERDSLTNQQINAITPNEQHDSAFIYYLLRHETPSIQRRCGGVATPIINKTDFEKVLVKVPTERITEQRIGEILSAYDNLIENNQRRIIILEQAARLLYREWFVKLRFPGHEHIEINDGLPEGWGRKTLGDIADTNSASYRKQDLPDEINYIDISSVNEGRVVVKTRMASSDSPGRARRKVQGGDIIWSNVRPNLRAYALILEPEELDVVSTGFTVLSAKSVPFSWLYMFVTTDSFVGHLVNHATGAGYPAVRPDDFERAEVLLPPKFLLNKFHELTEPNFRLTKKLDQQNEKLAQARDLLLPRLMNGEVAV